MIAELAEKHLIIVKTDLRSSMSKSTVKQLPKTTIALAGTATAYYDPRSAGCKFLNMKHRRFSNSDFRISNNATL